MKNNERKEHADLVRFLVDLAIKWHEKAKAYQVQIAELEAKLGVNQ